MEGGKWVGFDADLANAFAKELIYLTIVGMKQANVARLFKNARSVVNRKFHRLEGRLGIGINEMIEQYLSSENDAAEDNQQS